jgi:hypothetical protein
VRHLHGWKVVVDGKLCDRFIAIYMSENTWHFKFRTVLTAHLGTAGNFEFCLKFVEPYVTGELMANIQMIGFI